MVHTGQGLQLVEVDLFTAMLAVTALPGSTILTVVSPVLAAVFWLFHADAAVDLASVVVAEAREASTAVVVGLAGLFPVFLCDASVIRPGVADVLEAGESVALGLTVAVVYTGCEGRLGRLLLGLLVQTGQVFLQAAGGQGQDGQQDKAGGRNTSRDLAGGHFGSEDTLSGRGGRP